MCIIKHDIKAQTFGPVDARDFNTSFISTEHLKQKCFLNVVQLLSFNLMLLIFLKLTILLFLAAGVVICQQRICVCVFMFTFI